MDKFRFRTGTFLLAIPAGISIGTGCVIHIIQENAMVGSFLFSVGLTTVLIFRWNLFTGKVACISYHDLQRVLWLVLIWLGDLLGTFLLSVVMSVTCQGAKPHEKAVHLTETKPDDNLLSLFILEIFCGPLMYVAVEGYCSNPHPVGKYLGIIFSVMVFILSDFEHRVAGMLCLQMVGVLGDGPLSLVVITLGSVVGGAGCAVLHRLSGWLIEGSEPAKVEQPPPTFAEANCYTQLNKIFHRVSTSDEKDEESYAFRVLP